MESPSRPSDVLQALAALRAALLDAPPSGPNYAAEAARDLAIERMCELPPEQEPFVIQCLEEALAARQTKGGYYACQAAVEALGRRRSMSAASILGRVAQDETCVAWLRSMVVEIISEWDARAFEPVLRAVAHDGSRDGARAWAAEKLVEHGLAAPAEIDAFLGDPDLRSQVTRGLGTLANADAIVRLTEVALRDRDPKFRSQAWSLLLCSRLAPAPGGKC